MAWVAALKKPPRKPFIGNRLDSNVRAAVHRHALACASRAADTGGLKARCSYRERCCFSAHCKAARVRQSLHRRSRAPAEVVGRKPAATAGPPAGRGADPAPDKYDCTG